MTADKAATEVNSLCKRCVRTCRQTTAITLIECPRFLPRPFKIAEHRFAQLDLFGAPASAQTIDKTFKAKVQRGRIDAKKAPEDLS